jgi:hypothetical protein
MWILFACLLVLLGWVYQMREPLDMSPYDMVQEQAGVIQQLHEKITAVTLSEASVDSLQTENDQATDQINQLQQNMPSKDAAEQYPAE